MPLLRHTLIYVTLRKIRTFKVNITNLGDRVIDSSMSTEKDVDIWEALTKIGHLLPIMQSTIFEVLKSTL